MNLLDKASDSTIVMACSLCMAFQTYWCTLVTSCSSLSLHLSGSERVARTKSFVLFRPASHALSGFRLHASHIANVSECLPLFGCLCQDFASMAISEFDQEITQPSHLTCTPGSCLSAVRSKLICAMEGDFSSKRAPRMCAVKSFQEGTHVNQRVPDTFVNKGD